MTLSDKTGNVLLQRPITMAKQDIEVHRCLASDSVPTIAL